MRPNDPPPVRSCDKARAEALAEIQQLVEEGLASGPARPFDMDAFIARMKAR